MHTTTATGSLISATMRLEDLIPCFMREAHTLASTDAERAQLDEIKKRKAAPGYYDSEDAAFNLEELFDLLNEAAPEGFYFGSHSWDGADFGFWEDAYDLDDGEETETDDPRATTTDPTEGV